MNAVPSKLPQRTWKEPRERGFELCKPTAPFIHEIFRSRSLLRRDGGTVPLNVYIPALEGEVLYSLIRYLRPLISLEIGLANGISALHIAQALWDNGTGNHIAIDPYQSLDWGEVGLTTLERAGLNERVTLDPRPSHWVLPDLEQKGTRIQFAFVDGNHLFDYVMADFLGIDRILDVGGLLAFDDSDWPAIASVIRFAITNRAYEVFDVGVVVEPTPVRPKLTSRALRAVAHKWPFLQRILRPDFVVPAHELGILGRCVVLRKTSIDQRDGQSRHFIN